MHAIAQALLIFLKVAVQAVIVVAVPGGFPAVVIYQYRRYRRARAKAAAAPAAPAPDHGTERN